MPTCLRCTKRFIAPLPTVVYCAICTDQLFGAGTWSRYWQHPISLATGQPTIIK